MTRTPLLIAAMSLVVGLSQPVTAQDARSDRPDRPDRSARQAGATIGEAAPAFTLKDPAGKEHSLAALKGKTVILQWINPGCPVCKRVSSSGLFAEMIKDVKAIDANVVHLSINSTASAEPADSAKYMTANKLDSTALVDRDGRVGRLYGARTTPHVFVIDGKGVLRYQGAFDSDSSGRGGDVTNFVVNAVQQITAGETVTPDSTRPYGCSVKYARGAGEANRPQRGERGARGDRDMRRRAMEKYDVDGDGELSDEERQAMQKDMEKQMLEQFDKDGDGVLSDEEREAARNARRGQRGGRGGGGGGGSTSVR